jgi:DNA (cytosine-5)-methyltransferase 1
MLHPQFILPIAAELVVDLFAGGGGASTGIEQAIGRHVDIAINHDPEAVSLHEANHPQTRHFVSDVFEVDPLVVTDGQPVGLLWASPDCKHFSKAKGGKPVSKKIRSLAWVVVKWAAAVKPRVICLENVEEFQTWGPLGPDNRPCPDRKGQTFQRWKRQLERMGYAVEHRELRACDHGAPTIRKRLFLVARRDGMPIVWPEPTHGAPDSLPVKQKKLKPWRTAAECIDWSVAAPSIFERSKPLADATCRRIAKGIMRYVVNAADPFIVGVGGRAGQSPERPLSKPLGTVTSKADAALCVPTLVQTGYGEREGQAPRALDLGKPLGTVVAGQKHALVSAFLAKHYTGVVGSALPDPMGTATTVDHHSLVAAHLVHLGHGEGKDGTKRFSHGIRDVAQPLNTVTAQGMPSGIVTAHLVHLGHGEGKDGTKRFSHGIRDVAQPLNTVTAQGMPSGIVTAHMVTIDNQSSQGGHTAATDPLKTTVTENRHALVTSHMVKLRGDNVGSAAGEPLHTISAQGTHHGEVRAFLIKYYGTDQDPALREPMHTVTTKDRFGLVTIKGQDYAIVDIGLRMLTPRELYRAQGFPESYAIDKGADGRPLTKTAQVRMCGNSVCPPLARAIVAANYAEAQALRAAA